MGQPVHCDDVCGFPPQGVTDLTSVSGKLLRLLLRFFLLSSSIHMVCPVAPSWPCSHVAGAGFSEICLYSCLSSNVFVKPLRLLASDCSMCLRSVSTLTVLAWSVQLHHPGLAHM